jgi:glycine cleavage system H protein
MSEVWFTKEHEWIKVDGAVGTIGITDYAQGQLGDIVFVELPPQGTMMATGDQAAVVESVKAASEVYAPVSGEVVATNEALTEHPELVNASPTDEGWFFKLKISEAGQLDELMNEAAYTAFIEELE